MSKAAHATLSIVNVSHQGYRSSAHLGFSYVFASTALSALIVIVITAVLVFMSWDAITTNAQALFSSHWNPAQGAYGILGMLYGSVVVSAMALLLALPLGILSAIYISEYLPERHKLWVKSFFELLAGVPSIVYGLIAVVILSPWVENIFGVQTGRTLFSAGLILALMILPTIISLADECLQKIPNAYREAAYSLGLYKHEVIRHALLPIAKIQLMSISILALGRALGETMAVMLVIGSIDRLPQPIYNILSPGQTITSKLGREIAEAPFASLHFSQLVALGLCLLVIILSLSIWLELRYKATARLYD